MAHDDVLALGAEHHSVWTPVKDLKRSEADSNSSLCLGAVVFAWVVLA